MLRQQGTWWRLQGTNLCRSAYDSHVVSTGCRAAHGDSPNQCGTPPALTEHGHTHSCSALSAVCLPQHNTGDTPLMLAVQQLTAACNSSSSMGLVMPALRVLVLLCKHVLCDANMKDAQGRTALALLLQGYQQQQQQPAADKAAAATQASSSPAQPPSAPPPPNSPALAAVQLKAVQMLLHCGSDCNAADRAGMTPLMFAAAQPSISKELLQLLLEKGANARQLDNNRRSALAHAVLAHNLVLLPALGHSAPPAQPQAGQCPGCGHVCSSIKKSPGADKQEAAVGAAASQGPTAADAEAEAATADVLAANIDSGSNSSSGGTNPDLHAQVHGCTVCACSGSTSATHSSSSNSATHSTTLPAAPAPNPRHGMVVRALCSYGALDLHPQSINTRFPGVNGFTQLHIAMRRGDVQAAAVSSGGMRTGGGVCGSRCWQWACMFVCMFVGVECLPLQPSTRHFTRLCCSRCRHAVARCSWRAVVTPMPPTAMATPR